MISSIVFSFISWSHSESTRRLELVTVDSLERNNGVGALLDFLWGDTEDGWLGLDGVKMGTLDRWPGLAGVGSLGPASLGFLWVGRA